jgi:hypothetical protein
MMFRKFLTALAVVSVVGGLIGCGGKQEEAAPVNPEAESRFSSPKMGVSGAPGGGGAASSTSKPVTQ